VGKIEVLKKPDPEGAEALAEAAKEALSQWRYEPATRDGKPVKVFFTVVIDFKLDSHDKPGEKEKKDPGTPA
jgi:outer membrane biosynthesis protein TonB